ncbi:MAG: hypothetical protein IH892_19245 [Planctomycetes bacterium]|nr:hypothetical protein [Planctomycetota bacterium]
MLNSNLLSAFLMTLGLVCRPSHAQYGSGTGTPEDPYQIAMAQDLVELGNNPDDYDKHFILSEDIDSSDYASNQVVIASDTQPNTRVFQGTEFSGSFDGNDYRISNLTVTGESYLALFGRVESPGKVSNLGIVDVNVIRTDDDEDNTVGLLEQILAVWSTATAPAPSQERGMSVGSWAPIGRAAGSPLATAWFPSQESGVSAASWAARGASALASPASPQVSGTLRPQVVVGVMAAQD